MTTHRFTVPLHRRRFLASMVATGSVLMAPRVLATSATQDAESRDVRLATLDEALVELGQLTQAGEPRSFTTWNWAKTLHHCSQSIEFSMVGFPEPKSALFQNTVGSAAYEFFAWRGHMSHDLAEPIPGAPPLDDLNDAAAGEVRLRAAIQTFANWQDALQPHFAYGELTKPEYELAHAMHLANHFSFFRPALDVAS